MGTLSIPLSQGKFALIDEEDFPLVAPHRWYAVWCGKGWYARATIGGRNVYLHRLITNAPPKRVVDHINHDGFDNRRANLRVCSNGENMRNRSGRQRNNLTGYVGVSFAPTHGKYIRKKPYRAFVFLDGKRISCGCYVTAEEAARARDRAAMELHGEFATLNFPDEHQAVRS